MSNKRKVFGKKNEVSLRIEDYSVGLLGESGVGKTTVMKEVCEKLVGNEGYLFLDMGEEDGCRAITGINYEQCADWEKLDDVITSIETYKTEDYPDLKIVVIDTIDQFFAIAEPEVVRLNNKDFYGEPKKQVKTINEAYGGFQKGQDKAIDLYLQIKSRLFKVGVQTNIIGHVKTKSLDDVATEQSYRTLTSDLSQKYFNAVKTKLYFLGLAYIDRTIEKEKTGKKNFVTKQDETRDIIKDEVRKVSFRDDNFALDSKSRFADITPSTNLDADEIIKAMQDAIDVEHSRGTKSVDDTQKDREIVEAEKLKEITKAEKAKQELLKVKEVVEKVVDFIRDNKNNPDIIKPILDKTRELGYENPTKVDILADAKELLSLTN